MPPNAEVIALVHGLLEGVELDCELLELLAVDCQPLGGTPWKPSETSFDMWRMLIGISFSGISVDVH